MLKHLFKVITHPNPPERPGGDATAPEVPALRQCQPFLIRQPLYGLNFDIHGHALSLRTGIPIPVSGASESHEAMAEDWLLDTAQKLAGEASLAGRVFHLAIRATTLFNPRVDRLPADRIVLQISMPSQPALPWVERLQQLTQAGLQVSFTLDTPAQLMDAPLIRQARYFCLDSRQPALIEMMLKLERMGPKPCQYIALNVESEEHLQACRKLGFDYFRGTLFDRHDNLPKGGRLDSQRLHIIRVLNKTIEEADFSEIEQAFKNEVALTYKLMRYMHSASMANTPEPASILNALVYLGHQQLYRWLSLMLFTANVTSPRNRSLLRNALLRAHFMERLGRGGKHPLSETSLFLTGLFSQLDRLLEVPLATALAELKLPDEVTAALLRGDGPVGAYLELARACESLDTEAISVLARELEFDVDEVNLAHIHALIWSEGIEV